MTWRTDVPPRYPYRVVKRVAQYRTFGYDPYNSADAYLTWQHVFWERLPATGSSEPHIVTP